LRACPLARVHACARARSRSLAARAITFRSLPRLEVDPPEEAEPAIVVCEEGATGDGDGDGDGDGGELAPAPSAPAEEARTIRPARAGGKPHAPFVRPDQKPTRWRYSSIGAGASQPANLTTSLLSLTLDAPAPAPPGRDWQGLLQSSRPPLACARQHGRARAGSRTLETLSSDAHAAPTQPALRAALAHHARAAHMQQMHPHAPARVHGPSPSGPAAQAGACRSNPLRPSDALNRSAHIRTQSQPHNRRGSR